MPATLGTAGWLRARANRAHLQTHRWFIAENLPFTFFGPHWTSGNWNHRCGGVAFMTRGPSSLGSDPKTQRGGSCWPVPAGHLWTVTPQRSSAHTEVPRDIGPSLLVPLPSGATQHLCRLMPVCLRAQILPLQTRNLRPKSAFQGRRQKTGCQHQARNPHHLSQAEVQAADEDVGSAASETPVLPVSRSQRFRAGSADTSWPPPLRRHQQPPPQGDSQNCQTGPPRLKTI